MKLPFTENGRTVKTRFGESRENQELGIGHIKFEMTLGIQAKSNQEAGGIWLKMSIW